MVSIEYRHLSAEDKQKVSANLAETNAVLDRKFPKVTIGASVFILFILLFFIAQYEDYGFSVVLKSATIFPLTAIIALPLSYYLKRINARRIKIFYDRVLTAGTYNVLRVRTASCETFKDTLSEYFLFEFDTDRNLLLRINDFSVDRRNFPNDNFVIPPFELSDVVGNGIICEGRVIKSRKNREIENLLPSFKELPRGQTMLVKKFR